MIKEFLRAVQLSFKTSQNSFRLRFLQETAHELANDLSIEMPEMDDIRRNQIATLRTYRNTVQHWLNNHPDIDSNIWGLEIAQQLYDKSILLIQIGEKIIYDDIQPDQAETAEPGSGIIEAGTAT